MDAEEIIGMFGAAQKCAQNSTICYLLSKLRAQKNKVVDYLDELDQITRNNMLKMAVSLGWNQRNKNRRKCVDLRKEMSKRHALKREKNKR